MKNLDSQQELFLSFDGVAEDKAIEVVQASFVRRKAMTYQELFGGFDTLRCITYSYGMGFLEEIVCMFSNAEVILGDPTLVRTDILTVATAQVVSALEISKHKELVRRVESGALKIWLKRGPISHEKMYIMEADDGRRRVVFGSANMSRSAFTGKQTEGVYVFDGDDAFEDALAHFQELQRSSDVDPVTKAEIIRNEDEREMLEQSPMIKHCIADNAVIILPEPQPINDEGRYFADLSRMASKFRKMIPQESVPKPIDTGSAKMIAPIHVKTLLKAMRQADNEAKATGGIYPKLDINMDAGLLSLNDGPLLPPPSIGEVESDAKAVAAYFDLLDIFCGDIATHR